MVSSRAILVINFDENIKKSQSVECVWNERSEKKNLNFFYLFRWAIIIDNYLECGWGMMKLRLWFFGSSAKEIQIRLRLYMDICWWMCGHVCLNGFCISIELSSMFVFLISKSWRSVESDFKESSMEVSMEILVSMFFKIVWVDLKISWYSIFCKLASY